MGAIINNKRYEGAFMSNNDGVWSENEDGTWSEAVPLPFYGVKKGCHCGKKFWKEENYRQHYIKKHTDGKKYIRTPAGLASASPSKEANLDKDTNGDSNDGN